MTPSAKPLLSQVASITITIVLVALGLSWAWHLLQPLLPVLVAAGVLIVAFRVVRSRHAEW